MSDNLKRKEDFEAQGRFQDISGPTLPSNCEDKLGPLSSTNLILAILFAAGIFGVYLLSLNGGLAKASAQQQAVETSVDNALVLLNNSTLNKKESKEEKEIVQAFYYEARQRQIPLKNLKTNPFVYEPPRYSPASPYKADKIQIIEPQQEPDVLSAYETAEKLTLQSVLKGSSGATAMISNNLLAEGQKIGPWTVSEIRNRKVILRWGEHEYVLEMQ